MTRHEEQQRCDVVALEQELCRLPHIRAVQIRTGAGGRITEVHVVATTEKKPKQIVRDVETLALASYGIEINYRTVSVVCMDQPGHAERPIDEWERG